MTERLLSSKYWMAAFASFILGLVAAQSSTDAFAFSSRKIDSSNSSQSTSENASLVWVTRKDGATSCGVSKGQTLEDGASELQRNGVKVLNSRKGNDGKMHAMSCGMPTGSLNAYQISRDDLPRALTMGFQEDGHF